MLLGNLCDRFSPLRDKNQKTKNLPAQALATQFFVFKFRISPDSLYCANLEDLINCYNLFTIKKHFFGHVYFKTKVFKI